MNTAQDNPLVSLISVSSRPVPKLPGNVEAALVALIATTHDFVALKHRWPPATLLPVHPGAAPEPILFTADGHQEFLANCFSAMATLHATGCVAAVLMHKAVTLPASITAKVAAATDAKTIPGNQPGYLFSVQLRTNPLGLWSFFLPSKETPDEVVELEEGVKAAASYSETTDSLLTRWFMDPQVRVPQMCALAGLPEESAAPIQQFLKSAIARG